MKIPEWDLFIDDEYRKPRLNLKNEYYVDDVITFTSPETIVEFFDKNLYLRNRAEEHLYIGARRGDKIIGISEISHGSATETSCRMREIFIRLFLIGANDFFIIHNHPGDNCTPSKHDQLCLSRLMLTGTTMGIPIVDSIIVGSEKYYSAMEEGTIDKLREKYIKSTDKGENE